MLLKLILALTIIPILELVMVIQVHGFVSDAIGDTEALALTVGTILVTGIIGANLARAQGLRLLVEAQQSLAQGRIPNEALIEGVLVIIGGALLLTPGYATDVLGFSLLLPMTRPIFRRALEGVIAKGVQNGSIHVMHPQRPSPTSQKRDDVIDVEAIDREP